MEKVIRTEKLTFTYSADEARSFALKKVSLEIEKGSFVAVLGHNGSGKSTFAKHLNGILLPSEGKVYSYGFDTSDPENLINIRRNVGMVFQNPDNQLVATVVEEDVAFAPENMGVPSGEIRKKVDDALKTVGMEKFVKHAPHMLSGGQKQRIAIAGILAMEPNVLVMDEPTAMLDPVGRKEVMATIKRLNKENGITVILITHHMDEAAQADRIVVINAGEVTHDGTPREVFAHRQELLDIGLAVPQTVEILDELGLKDVALTVDECCDILEKYLKGEILKLENVSYTYGAGTPFEKTAVKDINLTFNSGDFVAIIGHTGSGKSTLVQHFNALLPPTSGKVYINGEDINQSPATRRAARFACGLVFQYPEYQLFEETDYKDIEFGPINMGLDREETKKRVLAASKFSGLNSDLLFKSPFDLSGGEKRRAAIAGIIAMDPDVLILDEPTAGLDPLGKRSLLKQIVNYHNERRNTVVFVSHSMEDIAQIADKIIVMENGRIKMFDTPRNVFMQDKLLNEIGLKLPQITRVMKRLKDKGYNIDDNVLTVQEGVNQILNLLKREAEING